MASVVARQGEVFEELGHAVIEHRSIVAAGLVAEHRRQPALADAGRADERQMSWASIHSPLANFWNNAWSRPTRATIIDVLNGRLLAQFGDTQTRRQSFVAPP